MEAFNDPGVAIEKPPSVGSYELPDVIATAKMLPELTRVAKEITNFCTAVYQQSNFLLAAGRVIEETMTMLRQSPEFMAALQKFTKSRYENALGGDILECFARLDQHSWFLDAEVPMSAPIQILEWLDAGNVQKVEHELSDYYRLRLAEIERTLESTFPHRKQVLESAFRAHRSGDYSVSIPTFLAQADGISREICDELFFQASKSIPAARRFLEKNAADAVVTAFCYPILNRGAIRQPTHVLTRDSRTFNRHAILHGLDSDYGTEINSLKSISLLSYLHGITVLISTKKGQEE